MSLSRKWEEKWSKIRNKRNWRNDSLHIMYTYMYTLYILIRFYLLFVKIFSFFFYSFFFLCSKNDFLQFNYTHITYNSSFRRQDIARAIHNMLDMCADQVFINGKPITAHCWRMVCHHHCHHAINIANAQPKPLHVVALLHNTISSNVTSTSALVQQKESILDFVNLICTEKLSSMRAIQRAIIHQFLIIWFWR